MKDSPNDVLFCTGEWQSLRGAVVEIRLNGEHYRRGVVDHTMPDASGLWMAADGFFSREFIDKAAGYKAWTSLYPASPFVSPNKKLS